MPITIVWRTDIHLSDHTPRSRTDNWTDTVLGKITQVGEIARDVGAIAVIDGGDFFDIKAPTRNSHALIQRAIQAHANYSCRVYANVGNHDCVYGDYSYLPQQPLGVLYAAKVFHRLYDEHEAVFTIPGPTLGNFCSSSSSSSCPGCLNLGGFGDVTGLEVRQLRLQVLEPQQHVLCVWPLLRLIR